MGKIQSSLQHQKWRLNERQKSLDLSLCTKQLPFSWDKILKKCDWQHLRKIDLAECQINCSNIRVFTQKPWNNLASLRLSLNIIDGRSTKMLVSTQMPNLTQIMLFHCHLGDQSCKHISHNRKWPKLRRLIININQIRLDGVLTISNISNKELEQVYMHDNRCGSIGLMGLVASQYKQVHWNISVYNKENRKQIQDIFATRFLKQ